MEELRSSEALDREILEDARRKAERSIAGAERQRGEILDQARALAARRIEALEAHYREKLAKEERDYDSSLPLERKRLWSAHAGSRISSLLDAYFDVLPSPKAEDLLLGRLGAALALFGGRKAAITLRGLGEGAALRAREIAGDGLLSLETREASGLARGVEATCPGIRFTFGLSELRDELLEEHREEIALAALGAAGEGGQA